MKKLELKLTKLDLSSDNIDRIISSKFDLIKEAAREDEGKNNLILSIANDTVTKSDKQRRLNWMWNNEVAYSGIGRYDDPQKVHNEAKYMFALPILLEGEETFFQSLYHGFVNNHRSTKEEFGQAVKWFCENHIHTENMDTEEVSKFLNRFQFYWTGKGVNLTDPSTIGLSDLMVRCGVSPSQKT